MTAPLGGQWSERSDQGRREGRGSGFGGSDRVAVDHDGRPSTRRCWILNSRPTISPARHKSDPGLQDGGVQGSATVLVADDDNDIVQLMRDYLEADGHTVLVANDGAAAVAAVAATDVPIVLLDVMMPQLSGFDSPRRLRERSDVPGP